MELTRIELEVMNVLWSSDRPLAKSEIANLCENKTWKDSYTHLLITGLIKKGALKESGVTKIGKAWASTYEAAISCEDYYANHVFSGSTKEVLPMLFHALIKNEQISADIISDLEDMLEKRKEELV